MANKNQGFEIVKVGVILFLITALAALILAFVNDATYPIITAQNEAKMQKAMKEVLPAANSFQEVDFELSETSDVKHIFVGDESGYVVMVSPKGYGGEISMAVGVDKDFTVTGISIISQTETAGLGAKCVDTEWQKQFVGKTENVTVVKSGAKDNQIDAISSATRTSNAVAKGVNEAISTAKAVGGDK